MARTRYTPTPIEDEGELAVEEKSPPLFEPDPVEIVPEPPKTGRFLCNSYTVQRNMEAVELFQLIGLVLSEPLAVELDEDAWSKLSANMKQHFRRVAGT